MRYMNKFAGVAASVLLATPALAGTIDFVKVADSFDDFASNQGENGWLYGYYNGNVPNAFTPDDFELMNSYDSGSNRWWANPAETSTLIDADLMHSFVTNGPNGRSNEEWAVRRWVNGVGGSLQIDIDLSRAADNTVGDGVRLHVFVDGVKRLMTDLLPGNSAGMSFTLFESVRQGAVIDFALDSGVNPFFDATRFRAGISRVVPSPASVALLGLGGFVCLRRRR